MQCTLIKRLVNLLLSFIDDLIQVTTIAIAITLSLPSAVNIRSLRFNGRNI